MSITTTASPKQSLFRGKKLWFFLTLAAAVAAVIFVLIILLNVTKTTTYLVLSKNISADQPVTTSDVQERTTSDNGQPPNAFTMADLQYATGQKGLFAKVDLKAGDTLTLSNTTGAAPVLSDGLPSNYVITSFTAAPSVAAGGNVTKGSYVDLYSVDDQSNVHLFLTRVLVVSATVDLDSSTSTASSDDSSTADSSSTSGSTSSGSTTDANGTPVDNSGTVVPYLFTVGVSQADAAKLIAAQQNTVSVVLSSIQEAYGAGTTDDISANNDTINNGGANDAGVGTDSSFSTSPQSIVTGTQGAVKAAADAVKSYLAANKNATALTGVKVPSSAGIAAVSVSGTPESYTITGVSEDKSYTYVYTSATDAYTGKFAGASAAGTTGAVTPTN